MTMKNFRVIIKGIAITVIAILVVNVSATAQEKGDLAAGAHVALGAGDNLTNFGLGAKLQYNLSNPIRLEGVFNYFLKKDLVSMWDLSLNGHYLFRTSEKFTVYPLAGLGILGSKVNLDFGEIDLGSASASDFGFNLGGGFDLKLSEKLLFNVQAKYMIAGNWGRLIATAGIAYRF